MSGFDQPESFAKIPHHAWHEVLMLGVGAAALNLIASLAGCAAYALGMDFCLIPWLAARAKDDER